jgi:predicted nucleotidyltransferase
MLRTERGPLRPLWAGAYGAALRAVAAYFRRASRDASVYVCRSLAVGEPVYGVSDIDVVVVVPGDPALPGAEHKRLKRRWQRLCRKLPPIGELFPDTAFYEDFELREAAGKSVLTYGLDGDDRLPRDRAAFFGRRPPADDFGMRSRPGLLGPMRDWRLVAGPERRPELPVHDDQARRVASWLELQFWWSFAFGMAADPLRPRSAFLCVKLIAEPARVWLALDGEELYDRRDVLLSALERLPEEESAIRHALELHDALVRSPSPPIAELLPPFVRLSSRIARRLSDEAREAGETEVRLVWGGPGDLTLPQPVSSAAAEALLPLVDWRALVAPSLVDEALAPSLADPADPVVLGNAAREAGAGIYRALTADGLLVLPALGVWERAFPRSVHCQTSDPVSFALAAGVSTARFPNVDGWRAEHWARRAVAEHGAWIADRRERANASRREWIDGRGQDSPQEVRGLAKLLTAARAALFLDSLEQGEPELCLTAAAVSRRLAAVAPSAATVESAFESYRCAVEEGCVPSGSVVDALREQVLTLAPLARSTRPAAAY